MQFSVQTKENKELWVYLKQSKSTELKIDSESIEPNDASQVIDNMNLSEKLEDKNNIQANDDSKEVINEKHRKSPILDEAVKRELEEVSEGI